MENIFKDLLYSTIRVKRISNDKTIAHHRVICYQTNLSHNYIDVSIKSRGLDQSIRMFYDQSIKSFIYYDNENNTKLIFDKIISKKTRDVSDKCFIRYHLDKNIDQYKQFVFISCDEKGYKVITEIGKDYDQQFQEEYVRAWANIIRLGKSLTDSNITDMLNLYSLGIPSYTILSIFKYLNAEYILDLIDIASKKNQTIKDQDYEKAASYRDIERKMLDKLKLITYEKN